MQALHRICWGKYYYYYTSVKAYSFSKKKHGIKNNLVYLYTQ